MSCGTQDIFIRLATVEQGEKGSLPLAAPDAEEALVEAAMEGPSWRPNLRVVLGRLPRQLPLPHQVLLAAAKSSRAAEVLEYLYNVWCPDHDSEIRITEEVLVAAASGPDAREALWFIALTWGIKVDITERVMEAVLQTPRPETAAAAATPAAAVTSTSTKKEISPPGWIAETLNILIQGWGGRRLPVTERVIRAAAGNVSGWQALSALVARWGKEVLLPVTEQVVEAAAGNPEGRGILLFMIWQLGRDHIPMTPSVLRAARGTLDGGRFWP